MEHETKKQGPSSSPSASKGLSGAHFSLEKETKFGGMKQFMIMGLLVAGLAGGAFMMSKKMAPVNQDNQEIVQASSAQELVTSILALSDEITDEKAKQKAAVAIKKHLEQKNLVQESTVKEIQGESEKKVSPLTAAQLGFFKGILTRCYIGGHDVHWVNETGMILEHVDVQLPLPGTASVARGLINESSNKVIVVVYEKGYEVYGTSGELIKTSQP